MGCVTLNFSDYSNHFRWESWQAFLRGFVLGVIAILFISGQLRIKKPSNQSPEPMPAAGTPPAEQESRHT
jgi:hypothetical protein